jgi:tellurite methyltransferase
MPDKEQWNERYRAATGEPQAAQVLSENLHLLPGTGQALDLACGLGANALLLAQQGLVVDAWDIADVAVAALQNAAFKRQLSVQAAVRDSLLRPPQVLCRRIGWPVSIATMLLSLGSRWPSPRWGRWEL